MSDWDPGQYLRFADARLRPALELLSRVGADEPATVVDAGCGPGNVLPHLAGRWPRARLVGVDSSHEMLEAAEAANPGIQLIEADLTTWEPDAPVDVLYSNAVFHWLDDHRSLFPRLMGHLTSDGWLAVQMPKNHGAPTHTSITEVIEEGAWADRLRPLERRRPVADPGDYHEILSPHAAAVDIWQTEYLQVLRGEDPVVEWARGSVLRPLLAALDVSERSAFLEAYRQRVTAAYPPSPEGTTLLPFRRLFIVAQRS